VSTEEGLEFGAPRTGRLTGQERTIGALVRLWRLTSLPRPTTSSSATRLSSPISDTSKSYDATGAFYKTSAFPFPLLYACYFLASLLYFLFTATNAVTKSVITGITTLFSFGLNTGGPGVVSVGWIVVSVFTFIVALGMAEIVSAIPTSGGPYFWAALLASPEHSAFASWITGW
jgi:hypothetical protein